jgi:hypothetical protein
MMGYNYYWSGSTTAGPVAPLAGENYNITRSIDEDYLDAGVLQGKLLLGVPWYGYDWPVTGSGRKAATTGSGTSRVYSSTLPLVASYGKTFDNATSVPWLSYQNTSGWRQMWFEDSLSLRLKTGFALTRHLAGIGIWALSYEAGRPELWNGIKDAVSGTTSSDDGNITEGLSRAEILGIAPNPVSERSLITCHIPGYCSYTLTLYDMEGRAVKSLAAGTADPGTFQVLLDADSFSPGLYICVLRTPAGSSTATLAIVKNK